MKSAKSRATKTTNEMHVCVFPTCFRADLFAITRCICHETVSPFPLQWLSFRGVPRENLNVIIMARLTFLTNDDLWAITRLARDRPLTRTVTHAHYFYGLFEWRSGEGNKIELENPSAPRLQNCRTNSSPLVPELRRHVASLVSSARSASPLPRAATCAPASARPPIAPAPRRRRTRSSATTHPPRCPPNAYPRKGRRLRARLRGRDVGRLDVNPPRSIARDEGFVRRRRATPSTRAPLTPSVRRARVVASPSLDPGGGSRNDSTRRPPRTRPRRRPLRHRRRRRRRSRATSAGHDSPVQSASWSSTNHRRRQLCACGDAGTGRT